MKFQSGNSKLGGHGQSQSESASRLPRKVVIREVGLRDGLQSIATVLPTAHKLEWIRAAYDAGQREIEVGSFVPARLLPQLADTAELRGVREDAARPASPRCWCPT